MTAPGCLVGAGEHRAEHHGVGARADRLRDVAGGRDPAVGDHGTPCSIATHGDVPDRGDLRHAHARDDARRADRARPLPDLEARLRRRRRAPRPPRRSRCCRRSPARRGRPSRGGRRRARRASGRAPCRRRARRPRPRRARRRARARRCPTPTAAATRSRPRSSFVASGYASRFEMSLTVMSPFSRPSRSTIGSFSIRCRPRIACASSSVVPTGAVTRPSRVIASSTRIVEATPKRRSRFVRIPTSRSSSSTIGIPETR